jgi:hypothetical protein
MEGGSVYRNVRPIAPQDSFDDDSEAGQLSQAAFLLATSLVVSGRRYAVEEEPDFEIPDPAALEAKTTPSYGEAVAYLDIDIESHEQERITDLAKAKGRSLATESIERAEPLPAVALLEASTHSEHELVRVAAAASAATATGPRESLIKLLDEGLESDDELVWEISATSLAQIDPAYPKLGQYVADDGEGNGQEKPPTNTAFITHGTWAKGQPWWQAPDGEFYSYIDGRPEFDLHTESFGWNGSYRHNRRQVAAVEMVEFIDQEGMSTPDLLAHSHGGTVAHLATQAGQDFNRLVLLSWPYHQVWLPDFGNVVKIFSFRVHYDLVIMADRGGQRFHPPAGQENKVEEHVHGWFVHSDPHEPDYWEDHGLHGFV